MGFLSKLGRAVEALGLRLQGRREGVRGEALPAARFRELLIEALEDPQFARQAARRLGLPTFPIRGGQACSTPPGDIMADDFNCGAYAFVASSATTMPLAVKGAASQTADLQQWQDSSGAAKVTVDAGGKVGIGTPTPAAGLDVATSNSTYSASPLGVAQITNSSSVGQSSVDFVINGTLRGRVRTDYAGDLTLVTNGGHFYFLTGGDFGVGTISMILTSAGKLGIGTSAPAAKLQLSTSNDTNPTNIVAWDSRHLVVGEGAGTQGGVGISYDQTNNVGFVQAAVPNSAWGNLILQSGGGKVGIGTTAPQQALTLGQGLNFATLMTTPGAPSLMAGGGGSLVAGTYYYKITALDANGGQTLGGGEASVTVGASGSVTVSWTAVPGASQYRVWRGTSPSGENFYNLATGTSYTDLGGGTPGTLPSTNTASGLELTAGGVSWFPYQPCVVPGGGFGFIPEGQPNPATVLYRSSQGASPTPYEDEDVTVLRTYRNAYYRYANPSDPQPDKYTLLTISAPPETVTFPSPDREATLTLLRADANTPENSEYLDLYNNYYPPPDPNPSTQYGIRIHRRGTGVYRDFVFDQYDGATYTPLMILKANANVGVGTSTPQTRLDVAGQARVEPITVASLPPASTSIQGAIACVADATATTYRSVVVGGGANVVMVFCDGANWLVF